MFGSRYGIEWEWTQIDEGNGNKNGYIYRVFSWGQRTEMNGKRYHQVMDFVTWGGVEGNNFGELP